MADSNTLAEDLENVKALMLKDDEGVSPTVEAFVNKYTARELRHLLDENANLFAGQDLFELLLDRGREQLPPELFLRFMNIYALIDDAVSSPLFADYGGIAEILMAMDTAVSSATIIRLGAQTLAVLAEHEPTLRAEVAAGDGLGLLIEALETHQKDIPTAIVLMGTFANIMNQSEEIKASFVDHNGLKITLDILENFSTHPKVVSTSLALLRNLSNSDKVRGLEAEGKVDVSSSVIKVLQTPEDIRLVEHGLWVILNLLLCSNVNKSGFVQKGGLDIIDTVLENHCNDEVLMEPTCLIIQQLAKVASLRKVIGSSTTIISHLVSIMRLHREQHDSPVSVLLPATKALYRLSFNEANRLAVVGAGAVGELLHPLLNNVQSAKLHRTIARTLLKLSKTDTNKEVIREDGGVGALVSSLNFYRDNSSVTSLMVRAMNYLFAKETDEKNDNTRAENHTASSAATANGNLSDEDRSSDSDTDSNSDEDVVHRLSSPKGGSSPLGTSPRDDISSKLDEIERITGDMLIETPDEAKKRQEMEKQKEEEEARRQAEAQAELKRQEEEALTAEAKKKADDEAAAKKKADDEAVTAAEAKKQTDEAAEKKRLAEEAEQTRLAAEAKKRTDDEAAAAAKTLADEAAAVEAKKLADEAAEKKRLAEEAEQQRAAQAKKDAEDAAEKKRLADEAGQKRKDAEAAAEKMRLADEALAQKQAEEAQEARRKAEVAAEQKRLADEAEKKRIADEAAAEKKRLADEAEKARVAELKRQAEEAEKKRIAAAEQAEADRKQMLAADAEKKRLAAEAEAKREADRRAREEEAKRKAEAERLKKLTDKSPLLGRNVNTDEGTELSIADGVNGTGRPPNPGQKQGAKSPVVTLVLVAAAFVLAALAVDQRSSDNYVQALILSLLGAS